MNEIQKTGKELHKKPKEGAATIAPRLAEAESIEMLAGSIAHELNNILTAVLGNIILAKMYAKPGSEISDILDEAEKASVKAENLTKRLLIFSKGGTLFKKTISSEEFLKKLCGLMPAENSVRCEVSVPQDLRQIEVDEDQLLVAFGNIIKNSVQAMPEGGDLKITAENISLDLSSGVPLSPGEYLLVKFQDSGKGIIEPHREKIFNAFFSTKENSLGLGLTSTLSIITRHNGYITIESKPGSGTICSVYLPFASTIKSETETVASGSLPRGTRVLVMDDEKMVRDVVSRMLDQCGCETEFAQDGNEMLELYQRALAEQRPFHAVIVDLIVASGMGGKEAVRQLLKIDPKAKAIASSGYSDDLILSDFEKFGFRGALPKPYNIIELRNVLYKVVVGPNS